MSHPQPSRRDFLTAGLGALALATGHAAARRRPNVLVILADDQGWGDLSVHGNTNLRTPRIDSLAAAGALFEQFLVCPVCAPTRAEFLTGRYHPRGGVHGVTTGAERLDLDETTLGDCFQAAGYATGLFGKWHNGSQYPYHPNGRGFAEFYGFCSGHWGQYFDHLLEHNGVFEPFAGYITDALADRALGFIEANRDRPFLCYFAPCVPHSPFQVPDADWERLAGRPLTLTPRDPRQERPDVTRAALAMVENLDANVGRVLDKLTELGLTEDTIVVYFSDNGPNSWRWNGDLKGIKGSTDEGGVRVPCLVRWPGRIAAGLRLPQLAAALDLLPTLCQMAGIERVGDLPLDGRSLWPLLAQRAAGWPDRLIFTRQRDRVSVRDQRYRYDERGALFDLQTDPGQRRDIAAEQPETAARLRDAVAAWREEMRLTEPDNRPFPVGYPAFPTTWLPARDGVATGQIKRSAGPPNSSFFTNWVDSLDTITWDVEVVTAGAYQIELAYTCAADDVGCVVEMSLGEARLAAPITTAWDPPLVGEAHDRVKRIESYVKDFRPLDMGRLTLPAGRGKLTLRALSKPGRAMIEVRAVTLRLIES